MNYIKKCLHVHCSTSLSMVTSNMAMTLRQGEEGRVSRKVSIAFITMSELPVVNFSTNFTEISQTKMYQCY